MRGTEPPRTILWTHLRAGTGEYLNFFFKELGNLGKLYLNSLQHGGPLLSLAMLLLISGAIGILWLAFSFEMSLAVHKGSIMSHGYYQRALDLGKT